MSTNHEKLIVVAGATGQQGGATVRHLLSRGFRVRALTRDAASESAQALAANGVEPVTADLNDPASLDTALQGAWGVFSVQNFWLPGVGYDGEIAQGKNLADAAKRAGVSHFVYSSVGGAERDSGIPHFESKWVIEQYVAELGLPATILRPVAFMENNNWKREAILNGVYPTNGINEGRTLQTIATDDIGVFAAIAFADPDTWIGKAVELAGDDLSDEQTAAAFADVLGKDVVLDRSVPENAPEPDPEMVAMLNWFNEEGYRADIAALRQIHPGLKSMKDWATEAGFAPATI